VFDGRHQIPKIVVDVGNEGNAHRAILRLCRRRSMCKPDAKRTVC
jgi:hypothetical protein